MNTSHQGTLLKQLHSIFKKEDILVNTKKLSDLIYPSTGAYLELDIWIPKFKIAFEFQDVYHYVSTWYFHHSINSIQQKDNILNKQEQTRQVGISLIVVPCWWAGDAESLSSTIYFQRPDLVPQPPIAPISLNPPDRFFLNYYLPDVGELMLASFPTSTEFSSSIQPRAWWMGEKYDGIRCCWNPIRSKMYLHNASNNTNDKFDFRRYTRNFRKLEVTQIKHCFPDKMFLDNEFWFGRGQFSFTNMLYNDVLDSVPWHELRVLCFDVPSKEHENFTFEYRYEQLLASLELLNPLVAPRVLCEGSGHLIGNTISIIENGGEGVILRKRQSRYERGRTSLLVKFKTVNSDKDALVVGVEQGFVNLKLPGGQLFNVPLQEVYTSMPTKGDIVTFTYEVSTRRELPVNPKIVRIRSDVEWEDVILSSLSEKKFVATNEENKRASTFTTHGQGYWTTANMRSFMIDFAKKLNLDPLDPVTWYNIPLKYLYQSRSGRVILQKFENYAKALQSIFPDIGLDSDKVPQNVWSQIKNRRKFFESYAKVNGFDPLVPNDWYLAQRDKLMAAKDINKVIYYHNESVVRALVDLFPEIGLQKSKLINIPWKDFVTRRKFLEQYAFDNSFDPYKPENWYSQSMQQLIDVKGMKQVIYHHRNSVANALVDLFPEIGLEKSKMLQLTANITPWYYLSSRKTFFENYAKENGFDPLIAENWYKQPYSKLVAAKGATSIISYHNNSISKALIDCFPDIGLDSSQLSYSSQWKSPQNRKMFFINYARKYRFDHLNPENWYIQPFREIKSQKGAAGVLFYYGNSVAKALVTLFPDIGIDTSKFNKTNWQLVENRKRFFEEYAVKHGFDPLNADSWYSQSKQLIASVDKARSVLQYHGNSVVTALIDLFPNIGLSRSKFQNHQSPKSLYESSKRRAVFEEFANANNFDPLKADNWYSQHRDKIRSFKGVPRALTYHNSSIPKALMDLFPDIGLEKAKFVRRTSSVAG